MNIDHLLGEAQDRGASDLHITVGRPPILRIDGALVHIDQAAVRREESEKMARQLLSEEKKKEFDNNGEVDTSYVIPDQGLFRVNCFRQRGVVGIAVRMLSNNVYSIEELELPPVVAKLALRKNGLILVTGPTGSGKTTTLATMVNLINNEKELHIVTLEDPIEYFHKHKKSIVSQREIGRDSTSFPSALRAALRQDPDVIMVGEMRDLETIAIAITAAETGHLVLATLHTIDAAQTVERMVDVFPSNQQRQIRTQLANSLAGVISQRLIRRKNGKGRIAVVESLLCTPAVRNLIREGKIHQITSLIQTGSKFGMQTMDKHIQELFEQGIISREVVLEYAKDEDGMFHYLKTAGNLKKTQHG